MKIVQIIAGGYGHRPKANAPARISLAGAFALMMPKLTALCSRAWQSMANRTRKPARLWNRQMPTATSLNRTPPRRTKRPAGRPARPLRSKRVRP